MTARQAIALVAASTLVIAACAGDDDSTGPSTSNPADTVATADTTPGTLASATSTPRSTTTSVPSTAAAATTTVAPLTSPEPAVALTEIGTFDAPVDLAWRAGDDALYVVEQGGTIERVGDSATTTVLDISDLTEAQGERGLLGLAFAPEGDVAYINYTDNAGTTTITEHAVAADGTFATADEARTVLIVPQPYPNHNGGDLSFGPDGMLYIGMGDGGSSGDPERRATNPAELLGKMLRIDPTPSGGQPYTVPPDNPFVDVPGAAPEVWASGLRNPWRFSFDRVTGDLWIADVGQNAFEEIDVAAANDGVDAGKGESFGWSALEGHTPFNDDVSIEDPVPPFFTYENPAVGCSVSGGVRVRGQAVPNLIGWYVYGDFCAGRIWAVEVIDDGAVKVAGRNVELGQLPAVTAVVDGPDAEVYVLSQQGPVVRLDPPA